MYDSIRDLTPGDAALFRTIRLDSLRLHPEAFGASWSEEASADEVFFAARLAANTVFGGFRDGVLIGTAGFRQETSAKLAHKAFFWGMFVRPEARGSGLSRGLVEAVLDHARTRVELIQLKVVADNAPARRLYESLGFEPYGIEVRSLKVDGRYFDEVLMVKQPL